MASLIDLSQLSWRFQNAGAALFEDLSLSIAPANLSPLWVGLALENRRSCDW